MKKNAKTRRTRRVAKATKPLTCQWVKGVLGDGFSGWHTCYEKAWFEVHTNGVLIGWVCGNHSIDVTQLGYQIR